MKPVRGVRTFYYLHMLLLLLSWALLKIILNYPLNCCQLINQNLRYRLKGNDVLFSNTNQYLSYAYRQHLLLNIIIISSTSSTSCLFMMLTRRSKLLFTTASFLLLLLPVVKIILNFVYNINKLLFTLDNNEN